ncbi:MAG TPA: hypothetical protein DF383_12375 [Deltaproteobacteria bacterium]|nr:hypothetical protein [Deltaproteobacteria bacterium]
MSKLFPIEDIGSRILVLRQQRVLLSYDLAHLYGVTTKALNQAVKRNLERFPEDFMFQLTEEEKQEVVTICDHLASLKFSAHLPYAFTEHGALMLSSVLKSPRAVAVSIQVVRAFVRLRSFVADHRELARKLATLEKRYDGKFKIVFEAIRELMKPPLHRLRPIGFQNPIDKGRRET